MAGVEGCVCTGKWEAVLVVAVGVRMTLGGGAKVTVGGAVAVKGGRS